MTEENATAQAQQPPRMNILAQFIRDMSFENILAQKGTSGEVQPDVQVQVNLDAKKRTVENQYEVTLRLKIESKSKTSDDHLFVMELDYAGVFQVENIADEQLHPFLLIECPRMLFPFVRRIVSDVSRDGGFPPLNLETIDFLALYRQELARRAQEQQQSEGDDLGEPAGSA